MDYNNIILFNIIDVNEKNFSTAARLIEKIENNQDFVKVCLEENYQRVRYIKTSNFSNKSLIESIEKERNDFLINHIDDLKNAIKEQENITYIFKYEKQNTLSERFSELQYFFLLKQVYNNCILMINDKCNKDEYFKISHYLYFETLKTPDTVFYKNKKDGFYKRLQVNNIGALTEFIPLINIDIDTYNLLSLRVGEVWNMAGELIYSFPEGYISQMFEKIWESCIALKGCKKDSEFLFEQQFGECRGLSILALYFFCAYNHFSVVTDPNWDESAFRLLALELTDGVLQLLENVCLHSEHKKGYLSFTYKKDSSNRDFKISVIDYAKSNEKSDGVSIINENFYNNLKNNDNFKKFFRYAKLEDFFSPQFVDKEKMNSEKFYGNYWDDYFYNIAENAAFHYGLQVFASVIRGYKGAFYVRSGYQYDLDKNQHYMSQYSDTCKLNVSEYKDVFPGTHFEILFPVKLKSNQKNVGFNSKISNQAFEEILKYNVRNLDEKEYVELYKLLEAGVGVSQNDKEQKIKNVKNFFDAIRNTGVLSDNKYLISRINFKKFHSGQMMEFFCKALMLFIKENKAASMKIAIVNCSDECMLEFVRWFLIFYDKHNVCAEMKNVEIYMVGGNGDDFLLSGESLGISQERIERVCVSRGVFNQRQKIISQAIWRTVDENITFDDSEFEIIPYDVLVELSEGKKIFEFAVLKALNTDLQSKNFGCKVENCHVRIGSKIHISNNFYEAHSLFHSNYYTSRFALLLAERLDRNMDKQIDKADDRIMLVGYETYSELLICEMKKVLEKAYGYLNIEYIIFDTENNDDFRPQKSVSENTFYINIVPINSTLSTHNKIISLYEKHGMLEENVLANFAIILIRDAEYDDEHNLKRIETGEIAGIEEYNNLSKIEKNYWDGIDNRRGIVYTKLVKKEIHYLIEIENQWNFPLNCKSCYPKNVMNEHPLIETNKASVVPTFMIGIKADGNTNNSKKYSIDDYYRKMNNNRLIPEIMDKDVLYYKHLCRNGNDYRFYINSEKLFEKIEKRLQHDLGQWCDQVKCILKNKISKYYLIDICNALLEQNNALLNDIVKNKKQELEEIKNELTCEEAIEKLDDLKNDIDDGEGKNKKTNSYSDIIDSAYKKIKRLSTKENIQSYDIIVSPVHHSNATWIDHVTECIFENMPAILHFDVQKEFRDNMKTKYSNLTMLYENLCATGRKFEINFHFVDDTIISGKTFHRAETLIHSLFPQEAFQNDLNRGTRVNLFKSVIILFNRMSPASALQYANQDLFFSYINICIPNLRNHEDACIMCKLVSDMNIVKRRSAMNKTAEFFERREIKYIRLEETTFEAKNEKKEKHDREYKRLFCTHRIFEEIGKIGNLRNDNVELKKLMLNLIDDEIKKYKNIESLNSMDECMEWIISYIKVFSRPVITFRKSFLEAYFSLAISMIEMIISNEKVEKEMKELKKFYDGFCKKSERKKELLDVLIKSILGGLGKVKSNYILRSENIINIFKWYGKNVGEVENFKEWYVMDVKRLLELSGDETKSLWLEKLILESKEWEDVEQNEEFKHNFDIESDFGKCLYIENTRLIYDAVSDLNKNFNDAELKEKINEFVSTNEIKLDYYYLHNFFSLLAEDREYYFTFLHGKKEKYNELCVQRVCAMVELYRHLNQKEELSYNKDFEYNQQIETYYNNLLRYMANASGACRVSLFGADEKEDRLKEIKKKLREICKNEGIDDKELYDKLKDDTRRRIMLYRIAWFDKDFENKKEGEDEIRQSKLDVYNAEEMLKSYSEPSQKYICIDKTLIFDLENNNALLKIHNNWIELLEPCADKNVKKIQVEPFYFYFDFERNEEDAGFSMLRGMRNVLTFRDSLVKRIEEDFNNNLIQLTMASQKKANDLSTDRAAGHTKMDEIRGFYDRNTDFFTNTSEEKMDEKRVMGDMLKLLADSYCSHKFKELYPLADNLIAIEQIDSSCLLSEYWKEWKEYSFVFDNCIFSRMDGTDKESIIAKLNTDFSCRYEKMFNVDYKECWILVVVLLIQNALKHGSEDKEDKIRNINIYIEDGCVVVENDISKETNIDELQASLCRTPEGKNAGISLWVIDQIIRHKKRQYYWRKHIEEYEFEKMAKISKSDIENVFEKMVELENPCVIIKKDDTEKKIKIMLPLLCE